MRVPRTSPTMLFRAALAFTPALALGNPIVEGNARFTVLTPNCIRIEHSPTGAFINAPTMFAVRPKLDPDAATVLREADQLTIDTGAMRLVYRPDGQPFSPANLNVEIDGGSRTIAWTPESHQTANLGGTINTLDQVRGPVSLEEGILSRDGWYLLDDSRGHLMIDDWVAVRPADAGTDWYLFGYGSDYPAAFRAFTTAGGAVPMPRKAVLGSWYSRWWKYTTEDYKNIVREYAEHDFPLDIIVMDMEWHTNGWTGWSWNYDLLDDPPALLRWFHEQGLAVTLNVHPADGVEPDEAMYAEFMREMGADPASGETIPYDAGDRRYMQAHFRHTHHPREDEGVDFWWLDWQQYPEVLSVPGLLNLSWLNKLYFDNSMRNGRRGLQFSRWGAWGDHRHPIHFSGDADTGWAMLGFEVPFTATAANEGAYFWSHDIGGHFGARNEEPYTRWVQFAATTAAMRLHSGIIEYLDRRPWMWPDWATESMRRSFHLRSELMPYVYSAVRQTHETGLPLNRPMYIKWPEHADAYLAPQQFMFGSDLLVAPIASPGYGPTRVASQLVWFPPGQWYNYFTDECYEGPEWRLVCADINEFPLFVRAGVPIPTQPYSARPTTAALDQLVVHLWPAVDGTRETFDLYEDDGISRDYEKGAFAKTQLIASRRGDEHFLGLGATTGTYAGQPRRRAHTLILHGVNRPGEVRIDGREATAEWDEATGTATIAVPAGPIGSGHGVKVVATTEPEARVRDRALARRLTGVLGREATAQDLPAAITASDNEDAIAGLLALAGVGIVENGTHYPYVGNLTRLVRNSDSPIAADGLRVAWRRVVEPEGTTAASASVTVDDLSGTVSLEAPRWSPADLEFLQSANDSRTLYATLNGKELKASTHLASAIGVAREWYVSPAFEFDRENEISKQQAEPESLSLEQLASPSTLPGWTRVEPESDGRVDLGKALGGENKLAYAVAVVDVAEGGDAVLSFRSDDGIEVWLNGAKIHSVHAFRGINHAPEEVPVRLAQGRNVLLVKVSQADHGWEFVVSGGRTPPRLSPQSR